MPSHAEISAAATRLVEHAQRYHLFKEHPEEFLADLHRRPHSELLDYLNWAERFTTWTVDGTEQVRPVVFLRRVVVTRILDGEEVKLDDLKKLEKRIEARDTAYFADRYPEYVSAIAAQKEKSRGPFVNWDPFRKLFFIDYFFIKEEVQELLRLIATFLRDQLGLKDYDFYAAGFDYNNSYGTDRCWLAVYPAWAEDHKKAYQVFLGFNPDPARAS